MTSESAPVAEIFSSYQGEGLLVGVRQVFVRFRGCPLTCRYCDTPEAKRTSGPCRVERAPGSGEWEVLPNPLGISELAAEIEKLLATAPHHSVSFTGGEPLLYASCLAKLMAKLRRAPIMTYLDTACCLPEAMRQVAPRLDWIAADLKLPSTMAVPVDFADFSACWEMKKGKGFIKVVVTAEVSQEELSQACRELAAVDPQAQVIIQPVTAVGAEVKPPPVQHLFALVNACAAYFPSVRVLPQCHRLLGVK